MAERSQALLNLDLYVAQHRRDPKGWEGVGTGYFRRNSLAFRCFSAWGKRARKSERAETPFTRICPPYSAEIAPIHFFRGA